MADEPTESTTNLVATPDQVPITQEPEPPTEIPDTSDSLQTANPLEIPLPEKLAAEQNAPLFAPSPTASENNQGNDLPTLSPTISENKQETDDPTPISPTASEHRQTSDPSSTASDNKKNNDPSPATSENKQTDDPSPTTSENKQTNNDPSPAPTSENKQTNNDPSPHLTQPVLSRLASLRQRVEKDPMDGEAWIELIADAEKKGDLEKTREVYSSFLQHFPDAVSLQIDEINNPFDILNLSQECAIFQESFIFFAPISTPPQLELSVSHSCSHVRTY
jgi:hypothetical protein